MGITVWPVDSVAGAPNYTGRMARQTAGALVGGKTAARPLGGTSGLIAGSGNPVTATSLVATVGQCVGVIDGETATAAGPYFFSNDTPLSVPGSMVAADATNPRVDLISFQISDPAEGDGTSVPGGAFVYTAGTAASSPVAPATPARAVAIAQINVPHSGAGSPSITDVAPRVVAAGGIIPAANSAAYPPSPYLDQYVGDAALGGLVRYNGSAWVRQTGFVICVGTFSITPVVNTDTTQAVLFSGGTFLAGVGFSTTPNVMVTPQTATSGTTSMNWAAAAVSTSGFTGHINRSTTTPTAFSYIAIGT